MSRRLRYGVAVSPDGFIAGPNGEYDWIVMDPSIDFVAMYKAFDTSKPGRDIWLYGGGALFRSLLDAGLPGFATSDRNISN
jgi:dihydrofolate reductase